MAYSTGRIGIDIGALFLKASRIDAAGKLEESFYQPHKGDPSKALEAALRSLRASERDSFGITGDSAKLFADTLGAVCLDLTLCQITAIARTLPGTRNIIDIGGGSATLVQLDQQGKFNGYATNSLCAAGTGSFLDEQATRLGISYQDMQHFEHIDEPPTIATRCSVFAKSDLIHRQQEGVSKAAMWSGLCRGMTRTLLATLLSGKPLDGLTAIIGGVARNQEVIRWLRAVYPNLIKVSGNPHMTAAIGAAMLAEPPSRPIPRSIPANHSHFDDNGHYPWTLTLEKSIYPDFQANETFTDENNNEIRIMVPLVTPTISVTLGIDIGSTSTKLVLVNVDEQVVLDMYRKTSGEPIQATQLLMRALLNLEKEKHIKFVIMGVGTTGSGRKMVGKVIGADAIINEISAHVTGAVKTDPSIDTIFEIGGQDSKYMHVVDRHIRDANMNYVCAAGTGSFVEEQAQKLGYPVDKVGPAILGLHPPRTTDRCTVFMEQDVAKQVQSGASPEDALAGVMVSVVKNYLNKVVGNRYRSRKKIFFQGATARNPALVAAFERLLDVQMVVSPACHVMGAYGVALLTRRSMLERDISRSTFKGLDLENRKVNVRMETCDLCQNHCSISFADIQGMQESPSWGYMCGRDPDEKKVRVNPHEKPIRIRQKLWREAGHGVEVPEDAPTIGIPQALTTYTYLPLWRRFFNRLGFKIVLSGTTTEQIRSLGTSISGAEFCFPVKVAMGHAATLALHEGVDFVFMPHMISEKKCKHTTDAKFCPYVQGVPSYTRSALEINGIDTSRILSPVVDIRLSEQKIAKTLAAALKTHLQVKTKDIRKALRDGLRVQRDFEFRCQEEGRKILDRAASLGEKLIILAGRPYNNYDTGINLGLPQKLSEHGRTVLPVDLLSTDPTILGDRYQNLYWNYGRKILSGIQFASENNFTDVVYLTNFNCGPDSFLLSYAEEIMKNKPFLALEMDEHGADAGYLTRIEAFCDVIDRPHTQRSVRDSFHQEPKNFKNHTIWIPPMHPLGALFFAAAFRRHGYEAWPLPEENQESFELGRSLTRGSECLPTALTIGSFLHTIQQQQDKSKKHALFMPTAEGPCRFGQYCTLHRMILDKEDHKDVAILSPSSFNSYQGVDERVRRDLWKALLIGDILFKAACKVRPYELCYGQTDRVLEQQVDTLIEGFVNGKSPIPMLRESIEQLATVERSDQPKPLVGIVGEIYVRCNSFANENVVKAIEEFGGEAWLTPMSEWILYTASTQNIAFWSRSNNFVKKWISDIKNRYLFSQERDFYECSDFLQDRHEPPILDVIEMGKKYIPIEFEGEALITVGRAMAFAKQGAAMVVNCAPFGCMPGTLTTALFRKISSEMGIPIVNLFYDGSGKQNQRLSVFLNNAVKKLPQTKKPLKKKRETTIEERL